MIPDQSWNWHKHKRIILHFHNCAGVAWTIIPYTFRVENDYFLFKSWNLFIMMCSIPSVILACLLMRLPESPKFLHGQGKHDETIDCLKFVHRWNNRSDVKFPVSRSARNTVMQMRCHVYYNRISYTTDCPLNLCPVRDRGRVFCRWRRWSSRTRPTSRPAAVSSEGCTRAPSACSRPNSKWSP